MKNKRVWQWVALIVVCVALIVAGIIILNGMSDSGDPAATEGTGTTETANAAGTEDPGKAQTPDAADGEETTADPNTVTEPSELPPEIGELTFPSMPEGIVLPEDTFAP